MEGRRDYERVEGWGGGGSNAVLSPRDGAAWDVRLRNVYQFNLEM